MVRTKIPSVSAATPSRMSTRGKRKIGNEEGEAQSKKKRLDGSNYVLKVLFSMNFKAFDRFESKFDGKKVLKGRVFDFSSLGNHPGSLCMNVAEWISAQGREDVFSHQNPTYPRMVQVLMCNYNPTSMKSWIGKVEIDLSLANIRDVLDIKYEEEEEEDEFIWPKKEQIFEDLAGSKLNKPHVFLPASYLSLDQKLAHNVVYNMIIPRVGSTDQVPEKDARIIWALERGKKLDLAQLMSDHLNFVKSNPKVPLPYGMYFTKFLIKYGIKVDSEHGDYFKDSDIINETTIKRMGYKSKAGKWFYTKGRTKGFPPPQEAEEETEDEEEARERRDHRDSLLDEIMERVEPHLPTETRESEGARESETAPSTSAAP